MREEDSEALQLLELVSKRCMVTSSRTCKELLTSLSDSGIIGIHVMTDEVYIATGRLNRSKTLTSVCIKV